MSSSMYCLADMAATSAAVWTDGVEAVGVAEGAATRGFLTAGGSAVSETRGIVDVCTVFFLQFVNARLQLLCTHLPSERASCRWP